jgi:hypothetical protein
MGLKNALCVLTKNEGNPPFLILSNTEEMDEHSLFKGPFGEDKDVMIDDYQSLWSEGADFLQDPNQGTRVHFTTSFEKFKSTYSRATKLGTLVEALREHLGVYYRHLLEYDQNHLTIRYYQNGDEASAEDAEVIPIFPVLEKNPDNMDDYPDDVETELDVRGNVRYKRGVVNWEKTREKYESKSISLVDGDEDDPPFRLYYRKNQSTQGVNIVFNGRTLQTSVLAEVWDNAINFGDSGSDDRGTINGHNRYNDFVGEIVITDHRFDTVNNKIGIDPDCAYWQEVKEELNDNEEYYPIKNGREQEERRYKKRLKIKWQEDSVTDSVYEEDGEWGVSIDLRRRLEAGGAEYLYEVKRSRAGPQDVYQLIMYWDAHKRLDSSNQNLTKGVLAASRITDRAQNILDYWNSNRTDAEGDEYNLEFSSLDSLSVSDGTWSGP